LVFCLQREDQTENYDRRTWQEEHLKHHIRPVAFFSVNNNIHKSQLTYEITFTFICVKLQTNKAYSFTFEVF